MSKEIDLTKPLSEFDLKYLVDRQRWADIRQNAANLDLPEPNLPSARGLRAQVPRRQLTNTDDFDRIAKQLKVKQEDEPDDGGTPETDQGAENSGGPVNYDKLTIPQLKELMDTRRAQYEKGDEDGPDQEGVELMSYASDAKKQDLVTALRLDDESSADSGDSEQ